MSIATVRFHQDNYWAFLHLCQDAQILAKVQRRVPKSNERWMGFSSKFPCAELLNLEMNFSNSIKMYGVLHFAKGRRINYHPYFRLTVLQ